VTELSKKLQEYIQKVEEETGRPVLIERSGDLGLSGMSSGFVEDPDNILVRISTELDGPKLEHSVAHEITHGLLRYKRGFPRVTPRRPLREKEAISVGILCSMLEDIAVNKITRDEGFSLFSHNYIEMVEKEESDVIKGRYFSSIDASDLREKLMVSRYMTSWAFVEYFDLDIRSKEVLERFLRSFESHYPEESQEAGLIKDIIRENDIFSPKGYHEIISRCLKLWGLYNLVELWVAE
jgi:hypothetical protein